MLVSSPLLRTNVHGLMAPNGKSQIEGYSRLSINRNVDLVPFAHISVHVQRFPLQDWSLLLSSLYLSAHRQFRIRSYQTYTCCMYYYRLLRSRTQSSTIALGISTL
jgi:hypothetical protein